ncbi:MAG: class I SAM-dependent methyltransferase, partial [Ferruginibacter sp.]|nr:class I SAM-dependent methyltransferase [Ferruginibacter sp.]
MGIENWTGERLETFVNSEVAVEHLHRYAIVLPLVNDKKVLDIASGEGYGSNLIAGHASQAIGVDICPDAIARANTKYKKNNLKFLEGSADAIPLANAFADVVVSFETLEHHDKHEEMLAEVKRVLKPDGFLIMSSPNKKYYTDERK